ncbi:MAG: GIY-YIG nuclease family protein [Candidatus Rifleibacteriota bacterium]
MPGTQWYTYIVICKDNSLYTGVTNRLEKRLKAHNAGQGARYTRSRAPVRLVYYETFPDRSEASTREYIIKQLTRKQKLKLINSSSSAYKTNLSAKISGQ